MNQKKILLFLLFAAYVANISSKVVVLNEYRGWLNCIEISNAGTRVIYLHNRAEGYYVIQ